MYNLSHADLPPAYATVSNPPGIEGRGTSLNQNPAYNIMNLEPRDHASTMIYENPDTMEPYTLPAEVTSGQPMEIVVINITGCM